MHFQYLFHFREFRVKEFGFCDRSYVVERGRGTFIRVNKTTKNVGMAQQSKFPDHEIKQNLKITGFQEMTIESKLPIQIELFWYNTVLFRTFDTFGFQST